MRAFQEEARRWLEEAEYDLEAAEDVLENGRFNWACFIAQQAAEKAVKSIYVARGEDVERVHSISALIKGDTHRGISGIPGLGMELESAMELDRHYIATRYPNGVPNGKPFEFYSKEKAEECVLRARRLVKACRKMSQSM